MSSGIDEHEIQELEETPLLDDVEGQQKLLEDDELADEIEQQELTSSALATVFLSLYVGVFLAALDGTIVATLLSKIASDFHEFRSVSWIVTGYLIAQATFQPLYGKLSDLFGRKPVLLTCNVLFGIGSVLCGIAPNLWFLVAARVIAGAGGGGLYTLSAIILSDIVSLRQRGLLQGIGNILYGCGAGFGGVVGGFLADTVGWRWTFAIQGPIIVLSIVAISLNLKLPKTKLDLEVLKRIDFVGSGTLVSGLCLFLFGVSAGGNYFPWRHPAVVVSLLCSFIFLAVFVYTELYIAVEPIIPLGLVKNRTVAGSAFTGWFLSMGFFTNIFYVAIYLLSVKGVSPTKSGSNLIPQFIGSASGSFFAGYYMRLTGRYYAVNVVAGICLVVGSAMLATVGMDTSTPFISIALFLPGFGGGLYLTTTLVGLIAAVPHEFQAVCTSIAYGFRTIGMTVGVATCAAIFQNTLSASLAKRITGPGSEQVIELVQDSMDEISNVPEYWRMDVTLSYLDAVRAVLITTTILAACCALSSLAMKEHVLHNSVNRR
ncbi:major facilitator superfamily-domain-containing protein [Lipomyces kononenkoae]|uniref:Major facilitator superfamily-domain-containing protein n=1 Tax=Lipomyces kononenkoae TaxID=34357 RepID=A0ACC3T5L2_LIPKO